MKTAVVCGAGGFIGSHLVKRLKRDGYWVRGVDIKEPEFAASAADEFRLHDLREAGDCAAAVRVAGGAADEVYQLAADMGGMGYIESAECEILHNSTLINLHMPAAAAAAGVGRYLFTSSVCVYRDMVPGEAEMHEDEAYPAMPDNEYGWEKLYAERVARAVARRSGLAVRIARLQNCYGPEGTWQGGREKAPAAIARKVAMAADGGAIEVWGDGTAVRSYTYVDDMVDGLRRLMDSTLDEPANIGAADYVTVEQLVRLVLRVAAKDVQVRWVTGPVGVRARNFGNRRIAALGWRPTISLAEGMARTYRWVAEQVARTGRC